MEAFLIMQHINIVLNNRIERVRVQMMSFGQRIASSKPELPSSPDHRHLPLVLRDGVPAEHGEGAAIVFPGSEGEGHAHHESDLVMGRPRVHPLGAPHPSGAGFGADGQRVVEQVELTEDGGLVAWRQNSDAGGLAAADGVVPIEMEMDQEVSVHFKGLGVHFFCV